MATYTVIPKNPACPSPVIEADGYEWRERVVFWRNLQAVVSEKPGGDPVIAKANGIWVLGPGQAIKTVPQVVAEFAVDWVAGVVTAKAD